MNYQHSFIIRTYFHSQNVEKHQTNKFVTLCIPEFVSFYHFSVPEDFRFSEFFFAILLTKITIKGTFYIYIKNKKYNEIKNNQGSFLEQKAALP